MIEVKNLIIGAGITGLILGKRLNSLNQSYLILEKSRGLGGRIATRRVDELGFDHGSSHLPNTSSVIELITEIGLLQSIRTETEGLFVQKGMTRIPKALGENLNILKDHKVSKISFSAGQWIVQTDQDILFRTTNLVITAPIPQALELLDNNNINYSHQNELNQTKYSMALMGLFICEHFVQPSKKISQVHSINCMKLRDLHPEGYVLRADPIFSEKAFENKDETNLAALTDFFCQSFESSPKILYKELKKWRYVQPLVPLPFSYLEVNKSLFLAGDGFGVPNIEGAIFSANALAEKLS